MGYEFVYQNSRKEKIKVLLFTIFLVLILVAAAVLITVYWYEISSKIPFLKDLGGGLTNVNLGGLFYTGILGGLFFIPGPLEMTFYLGLAQGNSIFWSFIVINFAYYLAQVINYFIGFKLSDIVLNLVSKKKVYQARRYVNKYGAYAIFFLNIIPGPAQLLTFALGITKYNFTRLSTLTILGNFIRYAAIIGIFILFR